MEVLEKEINDGLRTLKDIQLREQERQEIDAKRAACRELEAEYQHAKMETNRLEKVPHHFASFTSLRNLIQNLFFSFTWT